MAAVYEYDAKASHFRDREFAPVLARAMSFTPVEVRVPYIPARYAVAPVVNSFAYPVRQLDPWRRDMRPILREQVWPEAWNLIPTSPIRARRIEAGQRLREVSSHLELKCNPDSVLIWHCHHPHGFFSMFSLALGHAETCEKQGLGLVVDWSSSELLYRGPPGEPNIWNTFFRQPANMKMTPQAVQNAIRTGRYMETSKHHVVYGHYRGVIQDYGSIPLDQAAHGRALCRRNICLQPRFQEKLDTAMKCLKGKRRLAVHIRRSDKVVEAAANLELSDEALQQRIVAQCRAWRMDGVFLCSDDAALKQRLERHLKGSLKVSTYDATLPRDASQAVHFDKSLDSYKKAEDVVMEAFLMARGCHGLLSTYSNVSASVVYLSPDDFAYTTFWDSVEVQEVPSS